MNNHFINRIIPKAFGIKVIAVIILMMLTFAFFHSEFGLINFDEYNHGTHDYCEIVKAYTIKVSNDSAGSLVNLKVHNSICFHCIEKASEHISSHIKFNIEQFYTPQKNNDIYLHNRVFLI